MYYWVNSVGENYGAGTLPSDWAERYVEKGYNKIDPVVLGCFQRFDPTNWKDLDWSSKRARDFMADARAHGVGAQGLTIPVRGPNGQYAVLSINDDRDDDAFLVDLIGVGRKASGHLAAHIGHVTEHRGIRDQATFVIDGAEN